ncbi:MAG: T9SS type A sorting domain-containing protein [candidate division WOR-3 bacterium]
MVKPQRIITIILSILFSSLFASGLIYDFKTGTGAKEILLQPHENITRTPDFPNWCAIDSIPAPPGEMKMGLTEQNDFLWIFTNTTNSYSTFFKIRKTDGSIVHQFNFPDTSSRYNVGLTMINNRLYTSEFFPVQGNIHVLDTLGNLVRTFNTGYNTRGLAWDGQYLWAAEADSQSILKMDTLGNVLGIYRNNGSVQWFMDITWDDYDSTIWANDDAFALNIKEISVASSPFSVIQCFDHPSPETDIPEGITYSPETNGGYIYTSAAYSSFIWKIRIHDGRISENDNTYYKKNRFGPMIPTIFSKQLLICYEIFQPQDIQLSVYSIDGRKVCQIIKGHVNAGKYRISWDGIDSNRKILPAGVYFIRFESNNYTAVEKIIKTN